MARTPPSACTACGKILDGADEAFGGDTPPKPGDITMCVYCGHLMGFNADLTLRDVNVEEAHDIADEPKILDLVRSRKETMQ